LGKAEERQRKKARSGIPEHLKKAAAYWPLIRPSRYRSAERKWTLNAAAVAHAWSEVARCGIGR
jgi:hypothetical protein